MQGIRTEILNPCEKLADASVLKDTTNSGTIMGPKATIPGIYKIGNLLVFHNVV